MGSILRERASQLKRYREHFTIIFAGAPLPHAFHALVPASLPAAASDRRAPSRPLFVPARLRTPTELPEFTASGWTMPEQTITGPQTPAVERKPAVEAALLTAPAAHPRASLIDTPSSPPAQAPEPPSFDGFPEHQPAPYPSAPVPPRAPSAATFLEALALNQRGASAHDDPLSPRHHGPLVKSPAPPDPARLAAPEAPASPGAPAEARSLQVFPDAHGAHQPEVRGNAQERVKARAEAQPLAGVTPPTGEAPERPVTQSGLASPPLPRGVTGAPAVQLPDPGFPLEEEHAGTPEADASAAVSRSLVSGPLPTLNPALPEATAVQRRQQPEVPESALAPTTTDGSGGSASDPLGVTVTPTEPAKAVVGGVEQASGEQDDVQAFLTRLARDSDVEIIMPRRPRPVPLQKKAEETAPETLTPVTTPEEARSWLERLNRVANAEVSGEANFQALSMGEILTWESRLVTRREGTHEEAEGLNAAGWDVRPGLPEEVGLPAGVDVLSPGLPAPPARQGDPLQQDSVRASASPEVAWRVTARAAVRPDPGSAAAGKKKDPNISRVRPDRPSALARVLRDPLAREELPFTVRERLAPLLGADVRDVHLYRDAGAATATAEAGAEALAVGNAVLLAPGHDLRSPRTLGVVAHELTHVARERQPGFVPAIVKARPKLSALSEEPLAEQVEGRVRSHFEVQAAGAPRERQDKPAWGGLPAPWEPMPYWDDLTAARSTAPALPAPVLPDSALAGPVAPMLSAAASAVVPGGPVIHAASLDRHVPPPNAVPDRSKSAEQPAQGISRQVGQRPPDLELLAQQVYALVKRRLTAEIRRIG